MDEMYCGERIYIHGVAVDKLTAAGAEARIGSIMSLPAEAPAAIFTPNAEMIYRAAADPTLSATLNAGDVNVPDGVGTVWAARVQGTPLPERVAGIDLGDAAMAAAARQGLSVFLLGGKPGVAERAAMQLRQKHPGLIIAGTHHGYFETEGKQNQHVINSIRSASPALLIVCLGFPRQEHWILANRRHLDGVRVAMALGGSLDVWSGDVRRAPVIVREIGLEWLWRVVSSPSRIKRAMALPAFVRLTLDRSFRQRRRARSIK